MRPRGNANLKVLSCFQPKHKVAWKFQPSAEKLWQIPQTLAANFDINPTSQVTIFTPKNNLCEHKHVTTDTLVDVHNMSCALLHVFGYQAWQEWELTSPKRISEVKPEMHLIDSLDRQVKLRARGNMNGLPLIFLHFTM